MSRATSRAAFSVEEAIHAAYNSAHGAQAISRLCEGNSTMIQRLTGGFAGGGVAALALVLLVAVFAPGCATVHPDTGRLNIPAADVSLERKIAEKGNEHVASKQKLAQAPELVAYVDRVGQRLAAVSDRPDILYTFKVVDDDSINAFTVGYGYIYLNTGLIARMDNEAQFASVIAHELGHVTRFHLVESYQSRRNQMITYRILGTIIDTTLQVFGLPAILGTGKDLALDVVSNATVNGFSRTQEDQADRVGLEYMHRAGYEPNEYPKVFQTFLRAYGDSGAVTNFVFGDHSTNRKRYEVTSQLVREKYLLPASGRRPIVDTPEFQTVKRKLIAGAYY
ncbi:MAG: hypothetical protein FJ278_15675 [Planctomycetes bacterium]|nr:hypothetical protein [Planctomycetota bacterium]